MRSCGKHAVSTTIIVAPARVPIIRNQPLRSEAPSCSWHTIAAEVPAQNGLSRSSQNATKRARHTAAHKRSANSSDGAAFAKVDFNRPTAFASAVGPVWSNASAITRYRPAYVGLRSLALAAYLRDIDRRRQQSLVLWSDRGQTGVSPLERSCSK